MVVVLLSGLDRPRRRARLQARRKEGGGGGGDHRGGGASDQRSRSQARPVSERGNRTGDQADQPGRRGGGEERRQEDSLQGGLLRRRLGPGEERLFRGARDELRRRADGD